MTKKNRIPEKWLAVAAVLTVGLFMVLSIGPVSASCDEYGAMDTIPLLPMTCNPEHVWINGQLAPIGTAITFSGQNVKPDEGLLTDEVGGCGTWHVLHKKLIVQGTPIPPPCGGQIHVPDRAPIKFYINGIHAKVRIYKDEGCGVYSINEDPAWYDSLPWKEGATYDIELYIGASTPEPYQEPEQTGPCQSWDRNHVTWSDVDQYWLDTWGKDPQSAWVSTTFKNLALDWYVKGYRHEQTEERYQRMVFFADHGGYGCQPNLTAMIEGQGVDLSIYGWTGPIGNTLGDETQWSRLTAQESGENGLPSLFCPPINHPVLTENGYAPAPKITLAAVTEEPTEEQTILVTPTKTATVPKATTPSPPPATPPSTPQVTATTPATPEPTELISYTVNTDDPELKALVDEIMRITQEFFKGFMGKGS